MRRNACCASSGTGAADMPKGIQAGRWTRRPSAGAGMALSGGSSTAKTLCASVGLTPRTRPPGRGTAPVRPTNRAPSRGRTSRTEPNPFEGGVHEAQVVVVAEQVVQLLFGQPLADLRDIHEPLAEADALVDGLVRRFLHQLIGIRPAEAGVHEGVQDALRVDHAVQHL